MVGWVDPKAELRLRRRPASRKAVVLLVVVVMLAITCLMLYQVAGISFRHVRETIVMEERFRENWSLVSLRHALLPAAGRLFSEQELSQSLVGEAESAATQSWGGAARSRSAAGEIRSIRGQVKLNSVEFAIELQDESAKFSIPASLKIGTQSASSQLARLVQGSGLPMRRDLPARGAQAIVCWEDVFESSGRIASLQLARVTPRVTLWGDGRLNLYRAEEDVLDAVWRSAFGHFPPRELFDERERFPRRPIDDLRRSLSLRETDIERFDNLFTDTSRCFSLSIEPVNPLRNAAGARNHHGSWFFVIDRDVGHFALEH